MEKISKLRKYVPHKMIKKSEKYCTDLRPRQKLRTSWSMIHELNNYSWWKMDTLWKCSAKKQWSHEYLWAKPTLKNDLHPNKVLLSILWGRMGEVYMELLHQTITPVPLN